MVRPRQNHVGKTQTEKRRYWNTVIRAQAGPTLEDTAPIIDTTDTPAVAEEAKPFAYQPIKPPSAIGRFLRDRGVELVIGVIIIGLLGWGARELFTLNREVGELTSNLKNTQAAHSQLNSEIEKVEQRFVRRVEQVFFEVDKLERRIDRLIDRGLQERKNQ